MMARALKGSDESVMGKAYDTRLMRRLFPFVKPYQGILLLSVVLLVGATSAEIIAPLIIKEGIDRHLVTGELNGLGMMALLFFGVVLCGMGLRYFQTYATAWVGERVVRDLRQRLFDHLERLPIHKIDSRPVGWWMTRLTNDVQNLYDMFSSVIVAVIGDLLTLLGIVGVMLYINPKLALITFTVLPLLLGISVYFRKRVRVIFRHIREATAQLNGFLQEHITGVRTVQLFNQHNLVHDQFSRLNGVLRDAYLKAIRYYAFLFPAVTFVLSLATALILWGGGWMIRGGVISWGTLVAFLQYSERFFRPIRDLAERYTTMQSAMAAAERIFWLLDLPLEDSLPSISLPLNQTSILTSPDRQTVKVNSPLMSRVHTEVRGEGEADKSPDIEFEDVWFAYREEEPVLKGVSFKIEAGEKVAFVGHTGAGKTTIINLLLRLWDHQEGRIFVRGRDIKEWNLNELRRMFGTVLQDVFLFSGTIYDNITFGAEIDQEELHRILKVTGLSDWVKGLPQGIHTPVGEKGVQISAGQRQLISVARVLTLNPPILIMDEATSTVDIHTERALQRAMAHLVKGRTALIIAHRLLTVQDVDRIIVLHRGVIRESGTHSQLLELGGIYAKLYQLQFSHQNVKVKPIMGQNPFSV